MRKILSISLSPHDMADIKHEASTLNIPVSTYVLHLHTLRKQNIITEEELLSHMQQAKLEEKK